MRVHRINDPWSSTAIGTTSSYVRPDTWRIEKLNKDMQFNLYSPEYLGLHKISTHAASLRTHLEWVSRACCSHSTLWSRTIRVLSGRTKSRTELRIYTEISEVHREMNPPANKQPVQSQATPAASPQLRCDHPGVRFTDSCRFHRLFLPSSPGTPKSGAPPRAGFEIIDISGVPRRH